MHSPGPLRGVSPLPPQETESAEIRNLPGSSNLLESEERNMTYKWPDNPRQSFTRTFDEGN